MQTFGQWTAIADFPGEATNSCTSFEIDNVVYVSHGSDTNRFYALNTANNTWSEKAPIPGDHGRTWAVSFSLNGMGYIGGGDKSGNNLTQDFYKYDPALDEWTAIADFGGGLINGSFACSLNGKGYVIGGYDGSDYQFETWEYDPDKDEWKQLEHYPGGRSIFAAGFVLNGKIYMGTGSRDALAGESSFYEFTPETNTWVEKARFPGAPRKAAIGFAAKGYGFIGGGETNYSTQYDDFFAYDPENNTWSKAFKLGFASGSGLSWSVSEVVDDKVYMGTGTNLSGGFDHSNKFYVATVSDATVAVRDVSERTDARIYPNPAQGEINVGQSIAEVLITDQLGRVVLEAQDGEATLNISALQPGMYHVVTIDMQGFSRHETILKQ